MRRSIPILMALVALLGLAGLVDAGRVKPIRHQRISDYATYRGRVHGRDHGRFRRVPPGEHRIRRMTIGKGLANFTAARPSKAFIALKPATAKTDGLLFVRIPEFHFRTMGVTEMDVPLPMRDVSGRIVHLMGRLTVPSRAPGYQNLVMTVPIPANTSLSRDAVLRALEYVEIIGETVVWE